MDHKRYIVLAVDDVEDNLDLIKEIFDGEPYDLMTACDAENALKLAAQSHPDLALLDVHMPEVDGYELCRRLREASQPPHFPIIFLTAERTSSEDAIRGLDLGACDYMTKPIEPKELLARIRATLRVESEHRQREADLEASVSTMEQARRAVQQVADRNERLLDELRRANELVEQKNARLAELYSTAHQFVDNVSHEFRTPLTVIKEFTEIIHDGLAGEVNDEQREFLDIITNRVDDLTIMIDDMLDISKLEAGSMGVARRRCRLEDIVEHLTPTLTRKAQSSKIVLETEIPSDLPELYCDPEKAGRVILNLFVNAVKASGEAGRVRLWARRSEDRGEVLLGVTDAGPGIAPDNLKLIFDRFKQLDGPVRSSTKGFGLGLNIARELVWMNFGEIFVESELGRGSTFSFTLPAAEPASLLARYLKRLEQSRDTASHVSLLRIRAKPAPGPEGRDIGSERCEFAAFLQHQLRHHDLLFHPHAGAWILCIVADHADGQAIAEHLRRVWEEDRPRGCESTCLESIHLAGTWSIDGEGESFVRRAAEELSTQGESDGFCTEEATVSSQPGGG